MSYKNLLLASAVSAGLAFTAVAAQAQEAAAELETIVVTGSRLTTGFTAPTPVTTLGQAALQQRAPSSMAEALQELPSFRNSSGPTQQTRLIGGAGQHAANLRGLGAARTLVLVDGRRYVGSSANFTVDMAQIPSSLVERVDIVTGGASAAYGSDAVSGVVNFIMNDSLNGIRGGAHYGVSNESDGMEYVANLALGYQSQDGRFSFIIGGDYTKTVGIESFYERDLYRAEPGQVTYGATRAAGLPAQALLESGVQSLFTPGGVITNTTGAAAALRGTAFTLNGQPFQDNLGTVFGQARVNSGTNFGTNTQQIQMLYSPFYRRNAMARATYDVSDDLSVFAEFNYAFNTNEGGHGDTFLSTGTNIPISNPFIPAATSARMVQLGATSITLGRFNNDIGPWRVFTEWNTRRGAIGARGRITDRWDFDFHIQHGRTTQDYNSTPMIDRVNLLAAQSVITGPSGQPICNPAYPLVPEADRVNVQTPCVPFNMFGQQNSAAAIDYVTGSVTSHNVIKQTSGGLTLNGSFFDLPAGPVALAFGGEWRKDSIDASADPRSRVLAWQTVNQGTFKGSDTVKEAFAEIGVPLVKDVPMALDLSLNGAIRRTDYESSGAVTTWKVGATYEPTDFLRFRITESRDIRAPTPTDLFSSPTSGGATGIANPFTGQTGRIFTIGGGNPNLVPEVARTFTAGMVFTSQWGFTRGLRASIDVYDIEIQGVIGSIGAQDVIQRCFAASTGGTPNNGNALCRQIGFDNSIYGIFSVTTSDQNLNVLETAGVDFELAYNVPMDAMGLPGQLALRNLTTVVDKLVTTSPTGTNNTVGSMQGVADVQGNASATYTLGRFSGTVNARYFDDIRWNNTLIGPDNPSYNPALSNSINRNLFPGMVYLNLNASYDILSEGNRRLQVFGIINNALDKRPSLLGSMAANIGGSQLYDTVGRYFKVGARFQY
jgi:iron complex outermembrane receptor protein